MDKIIDYIKERIKWHNEDIENCKRTIKDNPDDLNIILNCADIILSCLKRKSECEAIIEKLKNWKKDGETGV